MFFHNQAKNDVAAYFVSVFEEYKVIKHQNFSKIILNSNKANTS